MSLEKHFLLEKYKLDRAHEVALNNATATYEQANLRTLLILNGGSATAYLALFGAMDQNVSILDAKFVLLAVLAWLVGVFVTGFATWEAYRSQRSFAQSLRSRRQATERRHVSDDDLARQLGLPVRGKDVLSDDQIDKLSVMYRDEGRRFAKDAKILGVYALVFFLFGMSLAILSMQNTVLEISEIIGLGRGQ